MLTLIAASVTALTLVGAPTAALAAKPAAPAQHKTPAVMFVLRGNLSGYTAATTTTSGTISVTVKSANFERKTLDGTTLTFVVGPKTHIVLHHHAAIANGDRGIVKIRALKGSDATVLQTETAFQVIDQGVRR
ncbi:MAG: hypothetical protein ACRDZ5_00935 [Acidimicrobiales bacterium]